MPSYAHISGLSTGAVPGSTLLDLCCRVADTVGFRLPTVATATAASGDTSRVVISTELRDDEAGYDLLPSEWLYVASGAQAQTQRRIVRQPEAGYLGPMGAVTVSRPCDGPIAAGAALHLTSPLPMRRHLGVPGYREAVNEGLGLIWIEVRFAVTGNGTHSYGLGEIAGYVQRGELQLVGLSDTRGMSSGDPPRPLPFPIEVTTSGADQTLIVPTTYSPSETFYLDAVLRADRLIWDGADWQLISAGQVGLQNDTDQCACPGDWAYVFGCLKAYQHLHMLIQRRNGVDPDDRRRAVADVLEQRQIWAKAARLIKETEMAPRGPWARQLSVSVASSW